MQPDEHPAGHDDSDPEDGVAQIATTSVEPVPVATDPVCVADLSDHRSDARRADQDDGQPATVRRQTGVSRKMLASGQGDLAA